MPGFLRVESALKAKAAAAAAFPQVLDFSAQTFVNDTTSHNVAMPATVASGNLLVIFWTHRANGGATVATPTGWTALYANIGPASSAGNGSCFIRVADGTEGGTNVNLVTSLLRTAVAQVYRIGSWFGSLAGVEAAATAFTASTNAPNPPSLSPSWGSAKTLWFAHAAAADDDATLDAGAANGGFPVSYTNGTWTISGALAARGANLSCETGTARRELEAASDDPGAFTLSEQEGAMAQTVAIRPAA